MQCENVRCPHYRKSTKRDPVDVLCGVTVKKGGCTFSWCKLKTKHQTHK